MWISQAFITVTSTSSTRHMYHMKRLLYGANFAASSSMSFSAIYLNLPPPLAFNLLTSFPMNAAQPLCTPRSPVEKTSMRFNAKHANISTDHRPSPRTAVNFSTSSSSLALSNILALSSPVANFWDSPWIYSAFRWESPAVRNVARSHWTTSSGVGNRGGFAGSCPSLSLLNKATNLSLIDRAAAPDTCCPMILLTRLRKGSISSASPSGENRGHGCRLISGSRRASVAIRCATAFSRRVPVVAVGRGRPVLEGERLSEPGG